MSIPCAAESIQPSSEQPRKETDEASIARSWLGTTACRVARSQTHGRTMYRPRCHPYSEAKTRPGSHRTCEDHTAGSKRKRTRSAASETARSSSAFRIERFTNSLKHGGLAQARELTNRSLDNGRSVLTRDAHQVLKSIARGLRETDRAFYRSRHCHTIFHK